MRCPACDDEYEDGVRACADCGAALVPADAPDPDASHLAVAADARLGTFHPAVAEAVLRMVARRDVAHRVLAHDDEVEVYVDREWRDDLRAELALTWREVLRLVDEQHSEEVMSTGGSAPGWLDAPRGGHVDRAGRLVVEVADEDSESDATRVVGPALLTLGAIVGVGGWYLAGSTALLVAGIGLVLVGLFVPR